MLKNFQLEDSKKYTFSICARLHEIALVCTKLRPLCAPKTCHRFLQKHANLFKLGKCYRSSTIYFKMGERRIYCIKDIKRGSLAALTTTAWNPEPLCTGKGLELGAFSPLQINELICQLTVTQHLRNGQQQVRCGIYEGLGFHVKLLRLYDIHHGSIY